MRLEQFAKILEDAGCGTRGADIFVHFMPATIRQGIALLPSLAGDAIDWETPNWRNRVKFQMIVRHANIAAGHVIAAQAVAALTILKRQMIPAMVTPPIPASLISHCWPIHDTVVYPRSPSDLFEFSTNFEAAFAIQS